MRIHKHLQIVVLLSLGIILLYVPFFNLQVSGPGGITPVDQRGQLKNKFHDSVEPLYAPSSAVYYVSNLAGLTRIPFQFGTLDVDITPLGISIQQGKMKREERIEKSGVHYHEIVYQVVQNHTQRDLLIDDIDFKTFRGSSAGMMLSLYLIQEADGVDLTHGNKIVGTGAVDELGNIIPVGGIKEKVHSAAQNDADFFLVPYGANEREAKETAWKLNADFEIIAVEHIEEALTLLKGLKTLPFP